MTKQVLLGLALLLAASPAGAAPSQPLASALRADLQRYLDARGKAEHISAVSLSVSLRDRRTIDVAAGTTSYGGATPATTQSLFQIGSNTKAFTSVLLLKLEGDGKLKLSQTVGNWLPQYPAWKSVHLSTLLDMTSGIATYDDTRAWEAAIVADPAHDFTPAELIAYVYGKKSLSKGWLYSNTGYALSELIAEKASGQPYAAMLRSRVIAAAGLRSTYYSGETYSADLRARTVSGYYDDTSAGAGGLKPLVGRDVRDFSVSWAGAAGAIVATPHDVAQWARQLYQGSILTAAQRASIERLVSQKTAKPISDVTPSDPRGFGLGVARLYKPGLGAFWFYEGMTLGYRVVHAYFPKQDVVVVVGANSQPAPQENQLPALLQTVAKTLAQYGSF